MRWTAVDSSRMSQALELAEKGRFTSHPNPRVGCVITRNDKVLGTGWHMKTGGAHAEINAMNDASCHLRGATAYISLEPCSHHGRTPPCTEAIIRAGISRVVIAAPDPNPQVSGAGIKALRAAGIAVDAGLMAEPANELNKGFIYRMTRGRPYVRCKSAVSLDGKTALAAGASRWLTGAASRQDVQELRAASSAVMTGINTILVDDPRLNVRVVDTAGRQPLRIVLDRNLRFPVAARMLSEDGTTILFTRNGNERLHTNLERAGACVHFIDESEDNFLNSVLQELASTYEVNDLLLEAGAKISGSMLSRRLIDELVVYQAPIILGSGAIDMMELPTIINMDDRYKLDLLDFRRIDEDWRFVFKPRY